MEHLGSPRVHLYALFLGSLQVDNLVEQLPSTPVGDIHAFVNAWVFAGTAMIATLTTGLAALSVFVDDSASGRFKDFLVSPVRRWELVLGYLAASFIIAFVMSMIVVAVGQLFLSTQGQASMAGEDWLRTAGYVALSAAAFSALSSFVVTFLGSSGGFSALSTVVGTLIGFLAGAYIPPGALPTAVVNVMNVLPFAQSAMLLRGPMVSDAVEQLADGNDAARTAIDEFYASRSSSVTRPSRLYLLGLFSQPSRSSLRCSESSGFVARSAERTARASRSRLDPPLAFSSTATRW